MPGDAQRRQPADCVIVGGGLAGLACAHELARAGRSVHVVEAADEVGGRARTVWREGRPVDLGFQVLFRAYPHTRRFLRAIGVPRRDLRPVGRGASTGTGSAGSPSPRRPGGSACPGWPPPTRPT